MSQLPSLETATPMMRQYLEIKHKYPDTLVFYRLGDFYELFYEDAKKIAALLDLTLTRRGTNNGAPIPMAGVPFHAVDSYISRLIKLGESVVICEQSGDINKKGPMTRQVSRIITPGTVTDEGIAPEHQDNLVAAIYKSKHYYGFAYLSLGSGLFKAGICASLKDLQLYIQKIYPAELIYPEQFKELSAFSKIISQKSLPNWNFDKESCYRLLCKQFATDSLIGFDIENLDEGICAAGALLSYVKSTQNVPLYHIRSIKRDDASHSVILDATAIRNLELLTNLSGNSQGSLLKALDHTITPMGERLLKATIVSPLRDNQKINARLNLVEALVDYNCELLDEKLAEIGDIERITARIGLGSSRPKDLSNLRASLEVVPEIKELLLRSNNKYLADYARRLNPLSSIKELLSKAILEEPSTFLRDGNVIAKGYNAHLDELRSLMQGSGNILESIEKREKAITGINTLKVGFNSVHGYFIEIPRSQERKIPEGYIRRQTLKNNERYITSELKELEEKTLRAKDESLALEKEIFESILKNLQEQISSLSELSANIASLDVLLGFAKCAILHDYTRPQISSENIIKIENGRHPVIETISDKPFIPNSIDLSSDKMLIITGPNMGGKSTFMRQCALICIMARCGSFVPAQSAVIGDVDRIFTRIGASDDLSSGRSTFMVEMEESASILNNATNKSLVIMDEVGRGTSTYEGAALAEAIANYLSKHCGCFALFSTHYPQIAKLAEKLPNVRNICFKAQKSYGEIVFLYKADPGAQNYAYAVEVACLAGVPDEITNEAAANIEKNLTADKELNKNLKDAKSSIDNQDKEPYIKDLQRLKLLQEKLQALNIDELTPIQALNLLYQVKKDIC